jgi:hypothetical protein
VQAADLISRIAPVMKKCDEEKLLAHLGVVLYENLGEEYPGGWKTWGRSTRVGGGGMSLCGVRHWAD